MSTFKNLSTAAVMFVAGFVGSANAAVMETFSSADFFNKSSATLFDGKVTVSGVGGSKLSVFDTEGNTNLSGPKSDLKFDADLGTGDKGLTQSAKDNPLGRAMIFQGPSGVRNDNAKGGEAKFDFGGLVNVISFGLLDIDKGEKVYFEDSNGKSAIFYGTGNNEYATVVLADLGFTQKMSFLTVKLTGSGSMDNIAITPLPAGIVLAAAAFGGLGGIGYFKKRRSTGEATA